LDVAEAVMSIPCWLSVDWDYFVRSLHEWDWGHKEAPFFQSGTMWAIRASQLLMAGQDLREEMDPRKWSTPKPETFWDVLEQLGYDFSGCQFLNISDSHAGAGPVFNEIGKSVEVPDVLINFDAHHDLGYHGWARSKKLAEAGQCMCDTWLCALMCWLPELKVRVIYPPWQTKKDLKWERKQIKEQLPKRMQPRVLSDIFYDDAYDGVSPVARPPEGETFDVQAIYICRSSAWTPPWLDEAFGEFVDEAANVTGLYPFNPYLEGGQDIDPLLPRSDFSWDVAVDHAEQMKEMMRLGPEGLRRLAEGSGDDEPKENPGYETEDGFIDWRDEPMGEHGPGICVTEMAIDDDKQGMGIGRRLYEQVETQWPTGTLVYVHALAQGFWEKMGFKPLYRQPDGVEWYDESYGSIDYWNQIAEEKIKRVGGTTPEPIVVTPEDLPS
jgi:GNAT superfamily N-acetyltransferase